MIRHLLILLGTLGFVACHDSRFGEPQPAVAPAPTTTIGELRAQFSGETFPITGEISVEGVVTSSDRHRNFYRTLCIEQNGAALEVMAGIDHLHNDYPIGCRVTLHLHSLALGISYGMLQVGRYPTPGSIYVTDYIASPAALASALIRHGEGLESPTPTRYTVTELRPEMAGQLIHIEHLRYFPEELTPSTWADYKRFTDSRSAEIYTYVRPYADFATAEIPAGECSLVGILQWDKRGEGRFILKLRDEDDCIQ